MTILQRYNIWLSQEHHNELTLYDAFAEGFLQALEWAQRTETVDPNVK